MPWVGTQLDELFNFKGPLPTRPGIAGTLLVAGASAVFAIGMLLYMGYTVAREPVWLWGIVFVALALSASTALTVLAAARRRRRFIAVALKCAMDADLQPEPVSSDAGEEPRFSPPTPSSLDPSYHALLRARDILLESGDAGPAERLHVAAVSTHRKLGRRN